MNIRNAHINFKLFLDKIDSEAYPEISPEEIDVFLNESIRRFVKVRYGRNNIYKTGFETTQKRIDDLKELVKTNKAGSIETSDYSLTGLNVYEVDLATLTELDGSTTSYKYQFHLKSRVHITKENCDLWTGVTEITQDKFNRVEKDPFNKPEGGEVLMFFEGNNIYLWAAQDIVVDDFITTFIKQPKQVKLGTTVLGDSVLGTNIISNVSDAQNMRIFVNDP